MILLISACFCFTADLICERIVVNYFFYGLSHANNIYVLYLIAILLLAL